MRFSPAVRAGKKYPVNPVKNKSLAEKTIADVLKHFLTYLKITGMNLGFLLNWKVTLMKDGIKRMVNGGGPQNLDNVLSSELDQ
jgi:hypothetical protein